MVVSTSKQNYIKEQHAGKILVTQSTFPFYISRVQ